MTDRPYRPGAGASAQAHYRQLAAASRNRRLIVAAAAAPLGGLAGLLLVGNWWLAGSCALWTPAAVLVWQWRHDHHRTWAKGAAGERKTARLLRPLERTAGYTVLHDRALPRGRANLDHLVIGPCGVIVVDSKNWAKNRVVKGGRYGRVQVGRVSGATIVKSTLYETRLVAAALHELTGGPVPVTAVLAIHGAKLPVWRTIVVDGVTFLPARKVRRWIKRQPAQLAAVDAARLGDMAPRIFPPYTG